MNFTNKQGANVLSGGEESDVAELDLAPHHRALLDGSNIAPAVAKARGYRTTRDRAELKAFGFSSAQCLTPALLVPIYNARGELATHQIRPDAPRISDAGKILKYETPAKTSPVIDVPPMARDFVGDPSKPLYITEGARKADCAVSLGLCCVSLPGVWNWRGSNEKGGKTALADWEHFALNGRLVYIVFDSDVMTKSAVSKSLVRLRALLQSRGATVKVIYLPDADDGAKIGLDDYFAAGATLDEFHSHASDELHTGDHTPRMTPEEIAEEAEELTGGEIPKPPMGSRRVFHLTDTGNAERFVAMQGHDLRFCHAWKSWLIWNGEKWEVDDTGEVHRRAKATVRSIHVEAAQTKDDEKRRFIADHAMKSEAKNKREALVSLAQSELGIPVKAGDFDAHPWLLNVQNGILDLENGKLLPHDRHRLMTKIAPVAYYPNAICPRWRQFLLDIMDGRESLVEFIQRAVGYSLTGDTREQIMFILHGGGSNGKSTLLEILRLLLGHYANNADGETLMAKQIQGGIPNDIARLRGARLVSAVETENGRRLSEVRVKQLTGGDIITARFLNQEFFEFKPQFKIFLATNHRPEIRGTDNAIWRRLRLIPFDVRFEGAKNDTSLPYKLQRELPGILAWAVEGCLKWQKDGLTLPPEVAAATAEYRADQDTLANFFKDCCVLAPNAYTTAGDLYAAYCQWSDKGNEYTLKQNAFGMQLRERGFQKKDTSLARGWLGIGLRVKPQQEPGSPSHQNGTDRDNSPTFGDFGNSNGHSKTQEPEPEKTVSIDFAENVVQSIPKMTDYDAPDAVFEVKPRSQGSSILPEKSRPSPSVRHFELEEPEQNGYPDI